MTTKTSYTSDFKNVNFSALDKKVWKDPTEELPSANSSCHVILIKNKHNNKDIEVVAGIWIPDAGYETGRFYIPQFNARDVIEVNNDDIYLYRDLKFLEV